MAASPQALSSDQYSTGGLGPVVPAMREVGQPRGEGAAQWVPGVLQSPTSLQ